MGAFKVGCTFFWHTTSCTYFFAQLGFVRGPQVGGQVGCMQSGVQLFGECFLWRAPQIGAQLGACEVRCTQVVKLVLYLILYYPPFPPRAWSHSRGVPSSDAPSEKSSSKFLWEPILAHLGPSWRPSWPILAPTWPILASTWPLEGHLSTQVGPKWPKEPPKGPPGLSKMAHFAPKVAQNGPKSLPKSWPTRPST